MMCLRPDHYSSWYKTLCRIQNSVILTASMEIAAMIVKMYPGLSSKSLIKFSLCIFPEGCKLMKEENKMLWNPISNSYLDHVDELGQDRNVLRWTSMEEVLAYLIGEE